MEGRSSPVSISRRDLGLQFFNFNRTQPYSVFVSRSPSIWLGWLPGCFSWEASCIFRGFGWAAGGVRTTVSSNHPSGERWCAEVVISCGFVYQEGPFQGRTTLGFVSEPLQLVGSVPGVS